MKHTPYELIQLLRILHYRFLSLENDRVEQSTDCVIIEWGLEAGHRVQSYSHSPDITSLVIAFILNNFRRQTEWSADNLGCFNVTLLVKDP